MFDNADPCLTPNCTTEPVSGTCIDCIAPNAGDNPDPNVAAFNVNDAVLLVGLCQSSKLPRFGAVESEEEYIY